MNPDFWKKRWSEGQTGFHLPHPHPALLREWASFKVTPGAPVLVPLCGKSLDIRWISEQGHPVTGVELSELACAAFFQEQGLTPTVTQDGDFVRYQSGNITLLQGNFFDLPVGQWEAVYDRAALIALPPVLRGRYAARIRALTKRILLITMDYPQAERDGPPFAVSAGEIESLYAATFTLHRLEQVDLRAQTPERWGALSWAVEEVWRLE